MIEISFTMLLQWINFGMLVFLLTFFLYKPLMNVLDKRRQVVEDQLADAKKRRGESEEILKEYKERLDNLKHEGRKIIDEARRHATQEKDKILDTAAAEAKLIIDNAQLEIQSHVEEIRNEIKKDAAQLIVGCASQIIDREVNDEDHQKYIDDFISKAE